jgi:hypothetical protein
MRICAKNPFYKDVIRAVREALPALDYNDAADIADGNVEIDEVRAEQILAKMPDPDELCELV